jgi:FdrA protein
MTATVHQIRSGAYYDSVVLMQIQRALAELPGIFDAGAVMATPANCDLLAQSDLLPPDVKAGPDDLLLVVRAEDEQQARTALEQVDDLIARRRSAVPGETFRPRSLESALRSFPDAAWVLISVPGEYAAGVARQALEFDRHVFLYSDNVTLEDELELKGRAAEKGLLVMGPDCGTAIVNGVGLGFANRVRWGVIGLLAASGTGLQAVASQVHNLGAGISQAVGTGGRDLSAAVAGATALPALDLLRRDPETKVLVLISKPPDPIVAANLLGAALRCDKPVVVCFLGYAPPAPQLGNLHFAVSLDQAAELAVLLAQESQPESEPHPALDPHRRYLRGLFSGGTLAAEALRGLALGLNPLHSNLKAPGVEPLAELHSSQAHTVIDLGEDEYTIGRPHPMLDNNLRLRRLAQESQDHETALILLDVVLGDGAHPDPAAELAPAIEAACQQGPKVAVLLIGTDEDPQGKNDQAERLRNAGAQIFEHTAEAVSYILTRLTPEPRQPGIETPLELLTTPLSAINVGLEMFTSSLHEQGASVVHVDWRPPAGGNAKLQGILERMKGK